MAAVAAAQGPESRSRASELGRIRSEIERLEGRLAEVESERGDESLRLERLRLEVRLQEERVAEAGAERRLVEEQVAALVAAIERLETRLDASRQRLQRGLASLYRLGGDGIWRSLLTASTAAGSLEARRALRFLSWRQASRVEQFRRDRSELAARRQELLTERRRAAELLDRENARLTRLASLRRQQAQVVAALERERAELEAQAVELAARQTRLTELLSFLASKPARGVGELPIQRFRGVLDWPLSGEVVQGFGPRLDPRYRTRVPHNGISLAPATGAEVRSIFPGRVVFAEDFEGFGITVVVLHRDRVFTLYSGLASAAVVAEDVISAGQILGRAADRLYFEVRVEDRPEDPLEWLR